jgi:ComB9 competence protein
MRKLLLITVLTSTCFTGISHAAVDADLASGGVVDSAPATQSELGSKIKMIGRDMNLRAVQEAFDTATGTENVEVYDYALNKTFGVRMRVNMSTLIVLPSWERIKAFALADDLYFSVTNFTQEGMENHLILQSNIAGIDTNLTVIGESGQIYNFYMRSDPTDSPELPQFTVYVKGTAPMHYVAEMEEDEAKKAIRREDSFSMQLNKSSSPIENMALEQARADYLASLPDRGEGVDINYEVTGDSEIAPRAVYSKDGWTFFDYRETLPSDRLPVPFKVVDGYDAVVNYRMEGGFMVVETESLEGWTLRNGEKYICVRKS